MPDTHIPIGQNVEHERPYELLGGNGYDFKGIPLFKIRNLEYEGRPAFYPLVRCFLMS